MEIGRKKGHFATKIKESRETFLLCSPHKHKSPKNSLMKSSGNLAGRR